MRGSIRARGTGKWEVRAYVGRDLDGRPVQKSRTVTGGRRKAEDTLRALQDEIAKGKHRTTRGTVAHLMGRYFDHLEGQGRSPSTLKVYRSYYGARIEPALGGLAVGDVTAETLDDFYAALRGAGLGPRTIRQYHAIMSGALKQAHKWGWVDSNVARLASPPQVADEDVIPPTVEQVQRLLELAEQRNPALATLLFVAATTGARRGELCALRWSKVDLERRTVVINANLVELGAGRFMVKDTKAHNAARIALDDATVAALAKHRRRVEGEASVGGVAVAADPFVFSQTLAGDQPYLPDRVTGFVIRLRGVVGMPNLRLHHLRHFMATRAIASGADVRTVAGRLRHDANVTLKVYAAFLEEQDRAVADHMGELLSGSSS